MKLRNKKIYFWLGGGLLTALFFGISQVLAANIDTGIQYGAYTGLVDTDIRIIIAKIIRAFLGLLGIVALALMIWGGYEYMTAAGNEEQVQKAKNILKNAAIGLAIILSSLAITQFVISKLTSAIISESTDPCVQNPSLPGCQGCTGPSCGTGFTNVFSATSTPQGQLPIKNIVVYIHFYGGAVDPASVSSTPGVNPAYSNIKIYKQGDPETSTYPGYFEFLDNNTLVAFHPTGSCADEVLGIPVGKNDCFAKDTTYKIVLKKPASLFSQNPKDGLMNSPSKIHLDCSRGCEATFTSGSKVDISPPTVKITKPIASTLLKNGGFASPEKNKVIAYYNDDVWVQWVRLQSSSTLPVAHSFVNFPTEFDFSFPFNPIAPTAGTVESKGYIPTLSNPLKADFVDFQVRAADLDNNISSSPIVRSKILPAHCWNAQVETQHKETQKGVVDVIPDCGLGSECGSCPGESCEDNLDCAGTFCDLTTHQCVVRPKILDVKPTDGAARTYVTIKGLFFGAQEGEVYFGSEKAEITSCPIPPSAKNWFERSVVVRAPVGSSLQPIELRTASYPGNGFQSDSTADDWGWKGGFTYNNKVRPGLSCIRPTEGQPGTSIIGVAGTQLGSGGDLFFGELRVNVPTWTPSLLSDFLTPTLLPQELSIMVSTTINGKSVESNTLPFTVLPVAESLLPRIDYIDPQKGPKDTFITIAGRNFGANTGEVIFQQGTGGEIQALPPDCQQTWTPTQIIMKVPNHVNLISNPVTISSVWVKTAVPNLYISNKVNFEVNENPLQPGLCSINPDNGPVSTLVTLKGESFGTTAGAVEYWQGVTSTIAIAFWRDNEITDHIPQSAKTGRVKVWSEQKQSYSSNSLNFKIQNCQEEKKKGKDVCEAAEECCIDGTCRAKGACPGAIKEKFAVYGWSFTTGQLPQVPKVLEQCGKDVGSSPTPSGFWDFSRQVCVNAEIRVQFSTLIKDGSGSDAIKKGDSFIVQKCNGDTCLDPASDAWLDASEDGSLDFKLTENILQKKYPGPVNDSVIFKPIGGSFIKDTWYRVILTTAIKSFVVDNADPGSEDIKLETNMLPAPAGVCPGLPGNKIASYCFYFKTRDSEELCKLGSARVTPDPFEANSYNKWYYDIPPSDLYNVLAIAQENACWIINADDYDWKWNTGDDVATTQADYAEVTNNQENGKGKPSQQLHTESVDVNDGHVWASTVSSGKTVTDSARLSISLSKPKVTDFWPNCNAACINAEVGVEFSQAMDIAKLTERIEYYDCGINNVCSENKDGFVSAQAKDAANKIFILNLNDVETGPPLPNHYYKIVIKGGESGVRSATGAMLEPTGESANFSWTFRYKNDANACDIDRVEMNPKTATVEWVGARASYYSQAFGPKDDCAPNGQKLLSENYNWLWDSNNIDVATITRFDRGVRVGGSLTTAVFCGNEIVDPDTGEVIDNNDINQTTVDCQASSTPKKSGTLPCLNPTQKNCCGNGGTYAGPEIGEECDLGQGKNGEPGSTCSANCLNTTKNPISIFHCTSTIDVAAEKINNTKKEKIEICTKKYHAVAVCGNGQLEENEECDLGASNGAAGQICSINCLSQAKVFGTGSGQCGNGKIEAANNEQCDGEPDCASDCQYATFGDKKIDPLQFAQAVGKGTVVDKKQITSIFAKTQKKASGFASDTGEFILQCGFEPVDASCPPTLPVSGECGTTQPCGAGKDSCCHLRPKVEFVSPLSVINTNVCPNTLISVRFSEVMNPESFSSSTSGFYNIILAKSTVANPPDNSCPPGQIKISEQIINPKGFWQKIKFFARRLFGYPVLADIYCEGDAKYSLNPETILECPPGTSETGPNPTCTEANKIAKTQVALLLEKNMATSTNYKLIVRKEIKNKFGVSLKVADQIFDFSTANKICKINQVNVDPLSWLFSTTGDDPSDNGPPTGAVADYDTISDAEKIFSVHAYYKNSGVSQELVPLPNVYAWTYSWGKQEPIPPTELNVPNSNLPASVVSVAPGVQNGLAQVRANLTITADTSVDNTVGAVQTATSSVQVFICENPWPSKNFTSGHLEYGLGYIDAEGGAGAPPWYNFKLLYCRDRGLSNFTNDDLPELRSPYISPAPENPILKEFFFTFKSPTETAISSSTSANQISDDKDGVGLRVYPNLEHLSLMDWYKEQPASFGTPVSTKLGQYDALQDGATYYIDGLNVSSSGANHDVYSNVYVFSFTNANTATAKVVEQLLKNFTLNLNLLKDHQNEIAPLYRDLQRTRDLKGIAQKLIAYRQSKGQGLYPKLNENPQLGTFLPGYTNSGWNSWQAVLGNLLGVGLPKDPLNGFNGCGTSTLSAFEATTCWNSQNSTFICPLGSHLYHYETIGDAVKLKADFEQVHEASNKWFWKNNPFANIKLCKADNSSCINDNDCPDSKDCQNSIFFQSYDVCHSLVEGFGGKCGDGIVDKTFVNGQPKEACEIGQIKDAPCQPVDDPKTVWNESQYPGLQKQKCDVNCNGFENIGSCVPQGYCGDKIKQGSLGSSTGPEDCDDGVNNGKYGYCSADCKSISSTGGCGDKIFDPKNEICDPSADINYPKMYFGWCSLDNTTNCSFSLSGYYCPAGKGSCLQKGPKYSRLANSSCSWDCQGRDYCGDSLVHDPYETCDKGSDGNCQVGKCNQASGIKHNLYCEKNEDCFLADNKCNTTVSKCDNKNQACVKDYECGAGGKCVKKKVCGNNIAQLCQIDADCNSGAACVSKIVGKRYCIVPGDVKPVALGEKYADATTTPKYFDTNYPDFINQGCNWHIPPPTQFNKAAATVSCLPLAPIPSPPLSNTCGIDADKDGQFLDSGEECDNGEGKNGQVPIPNTIPYGQSDWFCTYGCQKLAISSSYYCGNNIIETTNNEVCDTSKLGKWAGGNCVSQEDWKTTSEIVCSADCKKPLCLSGENFEVCKPGECPAVNLNVRYYGQKDEIFEVFVDGYKLANIIPDLTEEGKKEAQIVAQLPPNESVELKQMKIGSTHKLKIVASVAGGGYANGNISYDPNHVEILNEKYYTTNDALNKFHNKKDALHLSGFFTLQDPNPNTKVSYLPEQNDEDSQGIITRKFKEEDSNGQHSIYFDIAFPNSCAKYLDWVNLFNANPDSFFQDYPCISDAQDPGYVEITFKVK